jgi:predicted dienelactone hydrolase
MQTGRLIRVAMVLLATRSVLAADPYKAAAGPLAVASLEADWKDAARDATVPVKIYYPKSLAEVKEALPLIVFSHGLGGSRGGYQIWGEHWASHGYIVVHPTHAGSDTTAVLATLRGNNPTPTEVINPQTVTRRVLDINFVISQMEKANAGTLEGQSLAAFKGKVDVKHVGMAGHSFGSQTTLLIAGEKVALQRISAADPRVTAAIAMSPQGVVAGDQKAAFGAIKIPLLFLTGTADDSPPGLSDVKAADRRIPFDNDPFPETYLVIFQGAVHTSFSPTAGGLTLGSRVNALRDPKANTPAQETTLHTLVKESTTAFWDAYLKRDAQAKAWLQRDFAKVMGTAGKLEKKTTP